MTPTGREPPFDEPDGELEKLAAEHRDRAPILAEEQTRRKRTARKELERVINTRLALTAGLQRRQRRSNEGSSGSRQRVRQRISAGTVATLSAAQLRPLMQRNIEECFTAPG